MDIAVQRSMQIEDCLNAKFPDKKNYQNKARSLIFNLRDPKNPALKMKIIEE